MHTFSMDAIWQGLKIFLVVLTWGAVLSFSGQRLGMLLNILQCPGNPATLKNYPAPCSTSASIEKPWSGEGFEKALALPYTQIL